MSGQPSAGATAGARTTHEAMRAGAGASPDMTLRCGPCDPERGTQGFSVVREYCTTVTARSTTTQVLHHGRPGQGVRLKSQKVFTIEPMINAGAGNQELKRRLGSVVTQPLAVCPRNTCAGRHRFCKLTPWLDGVVGIIRADLRLLSRHPPQRGSQRLSRVAVQMVSPAHGVAMPQGGFMAVPLSVRRASGNRARGVRYHVMAVSCSIASWSCNGSIRADGAPRRASAPADGQHPGDVTVAAPSAPPMNGGNVKHRWFGPRLRPAAPIDTSANSTHSRSRQSPAVAAGGQARLRAGALARWRASQWRTRPG
jgi:hypothetical protein